MDNNDNCSRAWVLPKHPLSRNEVKMLVSQAASSEFQALLLLQAECQYPLIEEDVDLLVRAVSKSQQFSKQLLEQQCNYYLNDKQIKLLEDSSASLPKLSRELIKLVPKGTFYPNWAISIFNSFDLLSQEQIELLLACTACDDYSIISVIKRYSRMLTTEQLNKLVESSDSLHVLKEVAPILSYSQRQLLLKQIVKSSDLTTAPNVLR